jgi:transposase-like protein
MARRTNHRQKRTPESLRRLVLALSDTANISEAARRIGVSRQLAYGWYDKSRDGKLEAPNEVVLVEGEDPVPLHKAWDDALETATDALEAVAERLASGYDEPLVHQGHVTMRLDGDTMMMVPETIKKYDTRMLEILLKARRPEKFRERHQVDHSGEVKGGLLIVPGVMDPDEWAEMARKQQAKARGE